MNKYLILLFFSALLAQEYVVRINPLKLEGYSASTASGDDCEIALVLSGGGSRGLAQIGVLQILDSIGVKPDIIIGTSMGAVIGGLYAAGYTPSELESLAVSVDWNTFFTDASKRTSLFLTQRESSERYCFTMRLKNWKPYIPSGYLSAQRLLDFLSELTAAATVLSGNDFDNLPRRFRGVATDIGSGDVIILDRGNLGEALRAAIGVPLIFLPFPVNEHMAVDGGLKMPVPTEVAREIGCSGIIAVNTTAELMNPEKIENPADVAEQTTTIMQFDNIAREEQIADIWIEPGLGGRKSTDFTDADALISCGKDAARKKLSEILALPKKHDSKSIKIDSVHIDMPCFPDLFEPPTAGRFSRDSIRVIAQRIAQSGWFGEVVCSVSTSSLTMLHIHAVEAAEIYAVDIKCLTGREDIKSQCELFRSHPDVLNLGAAIAIIDSAIETLHRNGYAIARLDTVFIRSDTLIAVIDQGMIEEVRFIGADLTRQWVLESHLGVDRGEVFEKKNIQAGIKALYSTGLFQWVNYDITANGSRGVILTVKVEEKPNFAVRFGLRYDPKNRVEAAVGLFDDNFFGTALRVGMEGYGGERRQNARLSINADKIWKTMFTSRLVVEYHNERYDHFRNFEIEDGDWVQHSGGMLRLGRQLGKLAMLWGEVESRRIRVSPVLKGTDETKYYIVNKVKLRSMVDTYNKKQFPTTGYLYRLSFETSQDILGGETSFSKFFAKIGTYHTIGWFTTHGWVLGGHISGTPPFFERFMIGERSRFWGFRGDELLGDEILNAGIDLRINFRRRLKRLYMIAGGSMGNIWAKDIPVEAAKTIWGTGIGLGLETPIGPLHVLWGATNMETKYLCIEWGYKFE